MGAIKNLVSKVIHLEEVGLVTLVSPLVVSGDLGLVLHEDLHSELLLHRRRVVLL